MCDSPGLFLNERCASVRLRGITFDEEGMRPGILQARLGTKHGICGSSSAESEDTMDLRLTESESKEQGAKLY